jgi:nitrite reductase/ring-hydroxylating ferredoxin subunit/uncharacterized membrane protein
MSDSVVKSLLQGKPIKHPLHPMIVHLPIGLFVMSFILDVASYVGHGSVNLVRGSYYLMAGGVAMGLVASIPGFVDWLDIRDDHRSKGLGAWHMSLNLVVLAVYGVNLYARWWKLDYFKCDVALCVTSVVALGILFVSGYIGGMMVYHDGIGVGRHRRHTPKPLRTIVLSAADSPDGYVTVPDAQTIEDGKTLRLDIDGTVIALAKVNGEYYAFQDFCTHRCGPLSEGSFQYGQVMCPWHRSCFDMSTGQVIHGPAKVPIKTYAVSIIDGQVRIKLREGAAPAPAARSAEAHARLSERPWKLEQSEMERRAAKAEPSSSQESASARSNNLV